ncbi:unnamed protein product [Psylliodes chrysocephalus]|uniref:C2H2-type domain-containing protein n=1 Tax=Psylliodes chrysocephalus TaxID=3402493 RepID=A0A9P0DEH0_9CUCU|nr:unnamed protein product [Psylliodes chrysocephala]
MICFCCKKAFCDLYTLIRHFKLVHGLNTNNKIICSEDKCSQSFPNLSSFKRHVQKKHVDNNEIVLASTSSDISSILEKTDSNESRAFHDTRVNKISFENSILLETNKNDNVDISECLRNIKNSALNFTLSFHNTNNLTKKDVRTIQDNVTELITDSTMELIQLLLIQRIPDFKKKYLDINELLNKLKNPFELCKTDFKLNSLLKQCEFSEDNLKVIINTEIVPINKKGELAYGEKHNTGVVLPLSFQFKQIFEKIYNLDKCVYFAKVNASNNTIGCFTQGKLWLEKIKTFKDKIVLPYFLYLDDFEINNPLGSHATSHSMTAIYYSFPLFKKSNSKLNDIFLAGIFKASDVKTFGNNKCLEDLINELNGLQREGVTLSTKSGNVTVYFVLGLVLGDNLGLNSILGFTTSFNANYFCRFCKMHKNTCHYSNTCHDSILRNEQNYINDIQ